MSNWFQDFDNPDKNKELAKECKAKIAAKKGCYCFLCNDYNKYAIKNCTVKGIKRFICYSCRDNTVDKEIYEIEEIQEN